MEHILCNSVFHFSFEFAFTKQMNYLIRWTLLWSAFHCLRVSEYRRFSH